MLNKTSLKSCTYMLSAGMNFLTENPVDFITKCSVRFRFDKYLGKSKFWSRLKNNGKWRATGVQDAVDRGELSEAIKLIQNLGMVRQLIYSRKLARIRSTQKLLQFHFDDYSRGVADNSGCPIVLYILTNSLPDTRSGYTRRTQALMVHLVKQQMRISAVTRLGYPAVIGRLKSKDVESVGSATYFRIIPFIFRLDELERAKYASREIIKIARDTNASILHATTDFRNAIPTYLAAKELGIPWIYEVRGELESSWAAKTPDPKKAVYSEYYKDAQCLETRAMENADVVLTLSQVSKERIARRGIAKQKIEIIPNSVASNEIKETLPAKRVLRQNLGLPEGFILGTVTSVVSYEGLDFAIEAMSKRTDSECYLVIAGKGSALPELRALVKKLGLERRVIFPGEIDGNDAWKWYAAFDVFITPRQNIEVCRVVTPLKPVLAQALGVPVVASDLPALREVCAGNGFFFEPNSIDDFWRAVRSAAASDNTMHGIEWAKRRTWDETVKRLVEIYNGIGAT